MDLLTDDEIEILFDSIGNRVENWSKLNNEEKKKVIIDCIQDFEKITSHYHLYKHMKDFTKCYRYTRKILIVYKNEINLNITIYLP